MAVRVRLSRLGNSGRPFYRIIVADSRYPRDGRFIEKIGYYDPCLSKDNPCRIVLNFERLRYWTKVGAKPTGVVARISKNAKDTSHVSEHDKISSAEESEK